jgi:hypothetical protein
MSPPAGSHIYLNHADMSQRSRHWYTGRVRGLTEVAPGVLVATSSYDQTTTTVVVGSAGSGGCLLIDPAVTVAELARRNQLTDEQLRYFGRPGS